MKRKLAALLVTVLTLSLVLVGCGAKTDNATPPTKKIKIGLSMNTLNNPFFVAVKEGAEAEAKAAGIELIVTDAQNNPAQQIADVENLIQQKPDILIIDPADSDAIAEGVKKINTAKIPVFTIDRQTNGGEVLTHIGFDAIKSGTIAGEALAKALNGKGNVVEIQGIMGTNVARDRSKGFNLAMAKYPDIKIIAKQTANFDRGQALNVMENILQANPVIDGVYAANDEMAMGALAAMDASGRTAKIKLIGCDAIDPALAAIKAGKMAATIAEPPFFLGKEAIKTAMKISKGEAIEKSVILGSTLVTKDNVETVKTRD
ncbi:D-ribose ABC transporter substrate-binding protein [Desulfosporosinus fructosivorans]|uniref:D-ribose ABC transporter substrate-binding protein n=1 Tax=Desulfosporosinus fructosivorans TaxID=2018669 RepID=A0A4Z0RA91_9FIRM|nr:substrate-binding domain-containing protein [Desulfosporosinus fructosivorans]TGE39239.1 D-ribose ABC transporter substrate-binding protein [Desulfosporosinus fructosivorans]